jgi:hypothetical protein
MDAGRAILLPGGRETFENSIQEEVPGLHLVMHKVSASHAALGRQERDNGGGCKDKRDTGSERVL